ncbi:MAG: type II toxin-antitoxin system HicB family antitoxin [Clostridiales Family XIII bacterium]|jgi:predicted HicB family RNase H-like nuclease|nr:type II toxin-antitoxin system HicB family antitoxin [Clostridiales Family XIII bacterium]
MKRIEKYTYRVEWSEEDGAHIAYCLEFPSLAAHGSAPEKALSEIQTVVAAAVKWMDESGEQVPEPIGAKKYRGNISLRVSPDIHRRLAILSAEAGISLNQYIISKITL